MLGIGQTIWCGALFRRVYLALKFCGQNLTKFQSVIQLQENGHLVCSVRRRDKRQPSLEQREQSDEH